MKPLDHQTLAFSTNRHYLLTVLGTRTPFVFKFECPSLVVDSTSNKTDTLSAPLGTVMSHSVLLGYRQLSRSPASYRLFVYEAGYDFAPRGLVYEAPKKEGELSSPWSCCSSSVWDHV